jgi:hypothetical protein
MKDEILLSLEPLFEQAEAQNLFFRSKYQGLYFTAAELRQQHREGSFIWGPVNWELVSPFERAKEIHKQIESLQSEVQDLLQQANKCVLMELERIEKRRGLSTSM